jgi:ATP synthase protein I
MKRSMLDPSGLSIGVEFVLSVLVGLGGGYWLDRKLGTAPWCMIVGTGFGFATAVRSLFRFMRRAEREQANDARDPTPRADDTAPPRTDNDNHDDDNAPRRS